jgi:excisionase family DNA binding protein
MRYHDTRASSDAPAPSPTPTPLSAAAGLEQLLSLPPGHSPRPPAQDTAAPTPSPITGDRRGEPHPAHIRESAATMRPETIPNGAVAHPETTVVEAETLRLLTADQAASLLQVPASWLRKKAAAGLIAHTRIGRHLRFSTSDLQNLVKNGHRAPHNPS